MNLNDPEHSSADSEDISFKDLVAKVEQVKKYLIAKWLTIFICGLVGAVIGFAYAYIKKPTYEAKTTFVLDDGGKGSGLGSYAGLASLAGIDLGNNGSSVFQGDNILELYSSRLMLEKTLLTEAIFNNKKQLIIERYIQFNKLRPLWKKNDHIDSIGFTGDPKKFNRTQDSLITDIVESLVKTDLSVTRPDKKLSIIDVSFVSKDELFSQIFVICLVQNVNDFYVQTKTKKATLNVTILQKQVDSVRAVLNSSINGVASAIDAAPNANPALLTLRVPSQKKQVDVQASTAIYSEIVKNLELSKITLRQETPLIQVIDTPVLPLKKNKVGKIKGILVGGLVFGTLAVIALLVKKIFRSLLR